MGWNPCPDHITDYLVESSVFSLQGGFLEDPPPRSRNLWGVGVGRTLDGGWTWLVPNNRQKKDKFIRVGGLQNFEVAKNFTKCHFFAIFDPSSLLGCPHLDFSGLSVGGVHSQAVNCEL